MSDNEQSGWRDSTIGAAEAREHPETAEAVQAIERLRGSIDNVDTAIVMLLAERFKYTAQIGQWKARAGFAPADNPKIAVSVVIHNVNQYGVEAAGPIMRSLMEEALKQ